MAILFRKQFFLVFISTIVMVRFVSGEGTRIWEQSKFDDLSKGTATGVAIRSMGGLELAPAFKAIATTPSTYIWSIVADSSGNLYAAAGAPARVYRITPQGQSAAIFEPQELQVQALALDKNGILFAATNPDGKVYRIERPPGGAAAKGKTETDKTKTGQRVLRFGLFRSGHEIYMGPGFRRLRATCTSRLAITEKSFASLPRGSIPYSSKATKPTFACWRWTTKAI